MEKLFSRKFSDCSVLSNTSNPFQASELANNFQFSTEYIIEQQYFKKDILFKNPQNNKHQVICEKEIQLNELGEIDLAKLVNSLLHEVNIFQNVEEITFLYYDPISLVYHDLGPYCELKDMSVNPQKLTDIPQIHIEVKSLSKEEIQKIQQKKAQAQKNNQKMEKLEKKSQQQGKNKGIDSMTFDEMEMEFEFSEEEAKFLEQQLLQESILEQQILQAEIFKNNGSSNSRSNNNNGLYRNSSYQNRGSYFNSRSNNLQRSNSGPAQSQYDFVDNENSPNWAQIRVLDEDIMHEKYIFEYLSKQIKPTKKIQKDKFKINEIKVVQQTIQKWKKIQKAQKQSPEEAAKKLNFSAKVLQNYESELSQAEKMGFNLKNFQNESMTYLRKQIRNHTTIKGRYQYSDIQNLIQNDQIIEENSEKKLEKLQKSEDTPNNNNEQKTVDVQVEQNAGKKRQRRGRKSKKQQNNKQENNAKKQDDSLGEDVFQDLEDDDDNLGDLDDQDLAELLKEDLSTPLDSKADQSTQMNDESSNSVDKISEKIENEQENDHIDDEDMMNSDILDQDAIDKKQAEKEKQEEEQEQKKEEEEKGEENEKEKETEKENENEEKLRKMSEHHLFFNKKTSIELFFNQQNDIFNNTEMEELGNIIEDNYDFQDIEIIGQNDDEKNENEIENDDENENENECEIEIQISNEDLGQQDDLNIFEFDNEAMDGMEDEGFEGLNSLNNNTTTNVAVAI